MWVRSQDKKVLLRIKDVSIHCIKSSFNEVERYGLRSYGDCDEYYSLGYYSSKEKALKALDELQKRLDDELEMNLGVFQIPRDDEIKEDE